MDAEKLVFMQENQTVVYWGVEATVNPFTGPPIFQGVNVINQPIEWHHEHSCCSEFLILMLYWQAVWGGMEFTGICDISTKDLSKIRATWQFIGQIGEMLAFGSNGIAACVIGQDDDLQLIVGGRTPQDLDAIAANLLGIGIELERV